MKKKNILVLTYWSIDNALIHTYTLPYLYQIQKLIHPDSKIYLFTLSNKGAQNKPQIDALIQNLKTKRIYLINFTYARFSLFMVVKLSFIIFYLILLTLFKRINCLHAWCTPGGAIAYLVSIFTGRKLILDSFEPHAESMIESKTWKKNSFAFQLLFLLEKLQLKRAIEVICTTQGMVTHSQEVYGIKKTRYFVKPACVDLDLFSFKHKATTAIDKTHIKKVTCVYAGKFGDMYLEKEVFDFFKVAYDYWKGDFTLILLTAQKDEEIRNYCAQSQFPYHSVIKKLVNHDEVASYLALGNFGVCPIKPISSKRFGTPIKNGEYWAMGLPVVITKDISNDSEVIEKNNIGYVLQSLCREEYLNAVKKIDTLIKDPELKYKIRAIAEKERNFTISETIYKTIYV